MMKPMLSTWLNLSVQEPHTVLSISVFMRLFNLIVIHGKVFPAASQRLCVFMPTCFRPRSIFRVCLFGHDSLVRYMFFNGYLRLFVDVSPIVECHRQS